MNPNTTWSPGLRLVTPGPTSTTVPAPSWPPITGNCWMPISFWASSGTARSPVSRCSSEWHSPEPTSWTSTSPALGGSSSTSSTLQSVFGSHRTAAFIFMVGRPFDSCAAPAPTTPGDARDGHRSRSVDARRPVSRGEVAVLDLADAAKELTSGTAELDAATVHHVRPVAVARVPCARAARRGGPPSLAAGRRARRPRAAA